MVDEFLKFMLHNDLHKKIPIVRRSNAIEFLKFVDHFY